MQKDNMFYQMYSQSNTGFVRVGYNICFKNDRILEPVLMHVQFNGSTNEVKQTDAQVLKAFAGKDHYWEANLNFYLNRQLIINFVLYTATVRDGLLFSRTGDQ